MSISRSCGLISWCKGSTPKQGINAESKGQNYSMNQIPQPVLANLWVIVPGNQALMLLQLGRREKLFLGGWFSTLYHTFTRKIWDMTIMLYELFKILVIGIGQVSTSGKSRYRGWCYFEPVEQELCPNSTRRIKIGLLGGVWDEMQNDLSSIFKYTYFGRLHLNMCSDVNFPAL